MKDESIDPTTKQSIWIKRRHDLFEYAAQWLLDNCPEPEQKEVA